MIYYLSVLCVVKGEYKNELKYCMNMHSSELLNFNKSHLADMFVAHLYTEEYNYY